MNKKRIGLLIFIVLMNTAFVIKHFDRNCPINLATKTCLITGASSGIGQPPADLCHQLLRHHCLDRRMVITGQAAGRGNFCRNIIGHGIDVNIW